MGTEQETSRRILSDECADDDHGQCNGYAPLYAEGARRYFDKPLATVLCGCTVDGHHAAGVLPEGALCHFCQEPGGPECPLEQVAEHHAASGPGLVIYAHDDCPRADRPLLSEPHRLALEEAAERRIRGHGCAR